MQSVPQRVVAGRTHPHAAAKPHYDCAQPDAIVAKKRVVTRLGESSRPLTLPTSGDSNCAPLALNPPRLTDTSRRGNTSDRSRVAQPDRADTAPSGEKPILP